MGRFFVVVAAYSYGPQTFCIQAKGKFDEDKSGSGLGT